ncbi:uncharacterized protein LOC118190077 isoform X2 [Stegodyphus dumicola]|uniref:uncharacterized protein LOC118190077 isoform X2 n=1 Tax=Stegodyphus dumicola TaxID=202533 RepID=UPI0015AF1ACC|nr:uncharacterized protein LOC118190077 isoform X2 [Stegodyphus dumicola]
MGSVITVPITLALGLISVKPSDFVYWCKWVFSYIYIEINKRITQSRFDLYDPKAHQNAEKLGLIVPTEEFHLESPCSESHLQNAEDGIFCYGVNTNSECLIISIFRRRDEKADACIYLKLASGKTYRLQKTDHFQQSCTDKIVFSCGDLQMHYTCPMRRWRIFYSGFLRETNNDNDSETERMVYIKFAFRWLASSDVFDCTSDLSSLTLAKTLANVEWRSLHPPLDKFKCALNFYVQAGIIHGTVTVDDKQDEYELYLFGQRVRCLGDITSFKDIQIDHMLGHVHQNGAYIYLAKASVADVANNFCFGCIVQPDCHLRSTRQATITIIDSKDVRSIKASFQTDHFYKLRGSFFSPLLHFVTKRREEATSFSKFDFYMNGKKGTGIYIARRIAQISRQKHSDISEPKAVVSAAPLVVSFSSEICQAPEVTGGKGSSLGKLTELSRDLPTFIVPSGVVVTTSAYKSFITMEILKKIEMLEDVLYGRTEGNVKEVCESLYADITRTEFSRETREAIEICLKRTFGEKFQSKKFAIRSSATGEDTEQMSAAGQMDTFLGISGIKEILQAIKKCWASQFGYIAIQYKRRYGQYLNSPMAVVIQEMVACDVAGVLFTCDPLTGNPTVMTITANYGLGESVVSGSEEPDTIELQRDHDDRLSVKSTSIGAKSRKIIVKDGVGTALEEVCEDEKTNCCLTDKMIMRLGQFGIEVEMYYLSHRDIEWGFWNNNLYVFQSRPVTSGTNETVFEIDHEFDCPLRTENDFFSVANVGEVMPGAMSPLGIDYLFKSISIVFNTEEVVWATACRSHYYRNGWMTFYNHTIFNISDIFPNLKSEELDYFSQGSLIAFFGRVIKEEELTRVTTERYRDIKKPSMLGLVKDLLTVGKRIRKDQKNYMNYHIPVEKFKTSKELFDHLLKSSTEICSVSISLMKSTESSTLWNMFILAILAKASGGFNDEVYREFASLITTKSDVESADVPSAIQSIAFDISKVVDVNEFQQMSVEEALNWLQTTTCMAGRKFREFLERHGHRCLGEYDIYAISWGSDPKSLVKLLQNLAANVSQDFSRKHSDNLSEILSRLSIPVGFFSRFMLKLLLPMSRRGVQNREMTKSMYIKTTDEWRKAFRYLAKLLVLEGRIPEEDILFFMTMDEIKELLGTRSPKILASSETKEVSSSEQIYFSRNYEGRTETCVPVSQGVAEGFVRVAITLEEASLLKPGEILVTYSTDIGWTPCFPILAGVVTELGGLISHGAVVSREYGIPCIAGMHGATRKFQTGDYAKLDGNTGVLQKLPPPEDE